MTSRPVIILLTILSCLISHEIMAADKHYRHIMFRESPYASYRGIHPINEQTSQEVQHYEFSYDKQGRISRVSQKFGDQLIVDHGTWDSFIWFAPEVRINYQGNNETHTYFNVNGEQIAAHGNVWRAVYSLDEAGERTALRFYDNEGQPSESEWNIHRYEWRRSADGHIFEKRFNLKDEQEKLRPVLAFHEVKLEYDQDGKLMFMRNYGLDHKLTNNESGAAVDRITYDLAGNFIRWQVYDKNNNAVEGNEPMVHLGEHLYDAYGNKIGMRGFDRSGNQIPFSWGALMSKTYYNEHGIRSGYKLLKADGSLDIHVTYEYTEDLSHQTSISSIDENGELKNDQRLRGAARVIYQINEQGVRTPEFFYADGTSFTPS